MRLKNIAASPAHEAVYQDLIASMKKHNLPVVELLALTANVVGRIIAMQDQESMTTAMAMDLVITNMKQGNEQMMAELLASKGSA